MRKRSLLFISILAVLLGGGLAGCYDDKGNYDYRDINDVTVKMMPEAADGFYRYKLRPTESFDVTYTPQVTQSFAQDEKNLEYRWRVSYYDEAKQGMVTDSAATKELTLTFPPAKPRMYSVVFQLTDISTNVSTYLSMSMRTVNPYINSWLVLNGEAGKRRISSIEEPDSVGYVFTENAYTDMGNTPRFQNASQLIYCHRLRDNYGAPEWLLVLAPDSLTAVAPFSMACERNTGELLPSELVNGNRKLQYGICPTLEGMTLLADDAHTLYYLTDQMVMNKQPFKKVRIMDQNYQEVGYSADLAGTSPGQDNVLIWDENKREFMRLVGNWGGEGEIITAEDGEPWWKNTGMEVLWLGPDNVYYEDAKNRVAMVIARDTRKGECFAYHYEYGDKSVFVCDTLGKMNVNSDSKFGVSAAFVDQFFYTADSRLYLFNVASQEAIELYDAGSPIRQMKFRLTERPKSREHGEEYMRSIGLVVDKGANDELHEVRLNTAGDVTSAKVFDGFGKIQDICFTFIDRIVL